MAEVEQLNAATPPRNSLPSSFGAKYVAKLAQAEAAAAGLMDQIRLAEAYLREDHGYTLKSFANCTGLHRNSLIKLKDRAWIPEPETLWLLDRIVVRAAAKRRGETFPGETIKRGRPKRATSAS